MVLDRLTRRRFIQVTLTAPLATALPQGLAAQGRPESLLASLRGGGHVVYFRHGATTWSGIDRIEWPRERQRLLSPEGIAQSRTIGESFRTRGIPVGEVLASPFARCFEMAQIAFGRAEARTELLGLLSDDAGRADRAAFLAAALAAPVAGPNRIIVAHRSNISEVAGVALEEGEAVVIRPNRTSFTVLGTLTPRDW